MRNRLACYRWALALRGGLAVAFGTLALLWTATTPSSLLAPAFGGYAVADGLFAAIVTVGATAGHRAPHTLETIFSVLVGGTALLWPHPTLLILILLIGFWAIATGLSAISAIIVSTRAAGRGDWLHVCSGALSVAAGVLVLYRPVPDAASVAALLAPFVVAVGVLLFAMSLRSRAARHRVTSDRDAPAPEPAPEPATGPATATTSARRRD
jgi:uncharacterized membrane protein HdeD (DUF308 family)